MGTGKFLSIRLIISCLADYAMSALITDVKSLDTLDDRRELWHLLHRLAPPDRFRFLSFCCLHAYLPNSRIHPTASWFRMSRRIVRAQRSGQRADEQDLALTNEIYTDIWALVIQYGLSSRFIAPQLEVAIRRGIDALPWPAPSAASSPPSCAAPLSPSAPARTSGTNPTAHPCASRAARTRQSL